MVPRHARARLDGGRGSSRPRRQDHRQPVRTPGGDAALGGGHGKGHVQGSGLDIDGITAGAGGGTSLRNMLAGELPYAEIATSAAIAGSLAGVELKALASSSNHIGELTWAAKPDAGIIDPRPRGQEGRLYQPEVDHRDGDHRAQARRSRRQVEILPLGGLGPALTALAQGAVAAAPWNDPALTITPDNTRCCSTATNTIPSSPGRWR